MLNLPLKYYFIQLHPQKGSYCGGRTFYDLPLKQLVIFYTATVESILCSSITVWFVEYSSQLELPKRSLMPPSLFL